MSTRPSGSSRLESTSAPLPQPSVPPSNSRPRPSVRTTALFNEPARKDSRSPCSGGAAPAPLQMAETILARRGQLPRQQRSYRSSQGGGSVTSVSEERKPVWGVGGVFPRAPIKNIKNRRQPKTRDFQQERIAETEQYRRPTQAPVMAQQERYSQSAPQYTAETTETLPTPQLERPDPFASMGRPSMTGQISVASTRPSIAGPIPSHAPSAATTAESARSHSTTACGSAEDDEAASPTGSHDDEQGQVGGPLMEDNDQWEEEMEGDLAEPPVRNRWGRVRFALREPFAEWLGMLVLIIIGVGADCQVKISQSAAGSYSDMNFAWGWGVMASIYIAGGVSGGHINPALTLALATFRGFPWRMVPRYIIAQILGAFCGALIIYANYMKALNEYDPALLIFDTVLPNGSTTGNASATLFITVPNESVGGPIQGFCQEVLATAVLSIIVLALGDESNAPPGAGLGALVLGFVVTAIGMSMGWISGYAINPARDFGPRLALWCVGYGTELWTHSSWWWIVGPICGPIVGAFVGCAVYDALIFTGAGSPLNSTSEELLYSLRVPKIHGMVRAALQRDRPASAKLEAELENGAMVRDEYYRRAGRTPKKEVEITSRWEAGKAKVEREEKAMEVRRQERLTRIRQEREEDVASAGAET